MNDFQGKKFVVTGAVRGIGESVTRRLIGKGASVIGVYNTAVAEAGNLKQEFPDALKTYQADLADPASTSALAETLLGEGELDGLVNNAGIIDFQKWDEFSISQWRTVFAVNVDAPVVLIHALRKSFKRNACIVNIASTDGLTGSFGSTAYSASKAALLNVTKSLANLLGPDGIRVNAVAPGWIETEMMTDVSTDLLGAVPARRAGTPAEVAACVRFLASDEASYVTGAVLSVDGGLAA